jgi:hypothetical protein
MLPDKKREISAVLGLNLLLLHKFKCYTWYRQTLFYLATRITTSFSINGLTAGTAVLAVMPLCRQSRSECFVWFIDVNNKSIGAIFNVPIIGFEALTLPLEENDMLEGE